MYGLERAQQQFPTYFANDAGLGRTLENVAKSGHLLVERGDTITLLKVVPGDYETEFLDGDAYRVGRSILMDSSRLIALLKGEPIPARSLARETLRAETELRIDFVRDSEFGVYLPRSESVNFSCELSTLRASGLIEGRVPPTIVSDIDEIRARLKEVCTPYFFQHVIERFLEGVASHFETPRLSKNRLTGDARFGRATSALKDGDFFFIGSKQEVFMGGLARNSDGSIFYQGTYLASTKPFLFFTNSFLGHLSPHDMRRPLATHKHHNNAARYRGSNPPKIGGKYFVFPHIGREQHCKYTAMSAIPDIITGSVSEALWYLRTVSDFADREELVARYAEQIKSIPEGYGRRGAHFI